MRHINTERLSAQIEGDFVVFLIGMRVNKPWLIHKWLPVALAMPRMLKELTQRPELGMLGHESGAKVSVQYWRSFEHLDAYAKKKDSEHLPAWRAFNQSVGRSSGDVGIWHETYQIRAGEYESIYSGMPAFGLGKAGQLVSVSAARESARDRLSEGISRL